MTPSRSEGRLHPPHNKEHSRLYTAFIGQPVERWYLRDLDQQGLTMPQRRSIRRQAVIGWLQTLLLAVVLVQTVFAGLLRALPPDLRAALSFLHRIEWGAYLAVVLVAAQVAAGWASQIVLTNRFYLLAWRFGKPRLVAGKAARYVQIGYLVFMILLVGAITWVRLHGFFVQPTG